MADCIAPMMADAVASSLRSSANVSSSLSAEAALACAAIPADRFGSLARSPRAHRLTWDQRACNPSSGPDAAAQRAAGAVALALQVSSAGTLGSLVGQRSLLETAD